MFKRFQGKVLFAHLYGEVKNYDIPRRRGRMGRRRRGRMGRGRMVKAKLGLN
jgi:hypothetical protein